MLEMVQSAGRIERRSRVTTPIGEKYINILAPANQGKSAALPLVNATPSFSHAYHSTEYGVRIQGNRYHNSTYMYLRAYVYHTYVAARL